MAAPDAVSDGLELVDQFKIMRLLGRGAMAEVFLARDLRLGRKVALKLIRPQAHVTAEQVLREAQATARFSHPNIVSIYGVGEHAGRPYLALEYVEGDTLRLRLAGERPGLREAVRFALAIAEALREAHRHGVLHRDLKPENILCGKDGRLRVLDFGLALLERPAPGRPAHGGTPAYMAPELWRGDEPTTASDLWSFGVVLHELIHGVRVYDEPSFTLLSARLRSLEPAPVAPDPAGLPDEVGRLLRACLDKRAAGRPSADDAVRVLGAALSERPTAEPGQEATPFRGLASFTSEHAAFFFGREAEVAAALERLRGQPVLPIVGFSGAGKSSLVKAGIVPRLLEQGAWTVLELRPGRQPFHALARRLAAVAPLSRETAGTLLSPGGDAPPRERTDVDLDELAARLAAEPRLLAALLREVAAATRGKLFLFVDQLEELYTLGASAEDRARFLAALCGAADDPQDPVRVCFTVRDDFLGRLAESAALEHVLVLGSPAPDALGAILTRPLEHLGYRYDDPTIVDEMVGAIRGEHAGLPLLSFAARLLWERRDPERRVVCRSAYDAMGGVAGAIADHAERLLDGLSEREIGWVKRILLRLVTPERTRRIVAREDLLLDLPAEAGSLIDRLVDARLLTVRREVELAHESLIVRWSRLARWLDEGREELVFVAQAEQAAQLWHRRGRRVAELWSGDALLEARRVAGRTALALPPVARDFLAASERHERGRRNRRRVVWAAAASGLALLAAGASVAALAFAEKNAESRRRLAESHREAAGAALDRGSLVEARARLRTALEIDDATGARGLWWRLRSTPRHGRIARLGVGAIAFSPDSRSLLVSSEGSAVLTYHDVATLAERNVSRDLDGGVPAATHAGEGHVLFGGRAGQVAVVTLESGRTRYLAGLRSAECHLPGQGCGNHPPAHHGSTLAVFSSANASRLVSVGTDAVVNVWSLDGRATGRLVLREVPTAAALTPDGTRLVVTSPSSAEVQLWNLDTGELARSLTAAAAGGRVAVSPDGPALVWGGGDGIVQVFPFDGAEPRTWRTRHARVTALAVSSDGKYLVTGGDRTAQLWRLADGVAVEAFGTELDGIHELALAPDGSLLAVATQGGVELFALDHAPEQEVRRGHGDAVTSVATTPDGRLGITGGADRTIRLWDRSTGDLLDVLEGHGDRVNALAVSHDGAWLASAGNDATVRLWQLPSGRAGRTLPGHGGPVVDVDFDPGGAWLAAAGGDGISLWPLAGDDPPRVLRGRGRVTSVRFSRDGARLAAGAVDGTVHIWTTEGWKLERVLDAVHRVDAIAFAPDGRALVSSARGADLLGRVWLWDLAAGTHRELVAAEPASIGKPVFLPDGRMYHAASNRRGSFLLDPTTGAETKLAPGFAEVWTPSLDGHTAIAQASRNLVTMQDVDRAKVLWLGIALFAERGELLTHRGWERLEPGFPRLADAGAGWRRAIEARGWVADATADLACSYTRERQLELWDIRADRLLFTAPVQVRSGWGGKIRALEDGCLVLDKSGHPLADRAVFFRRDGGEPVVLAQEVYAAALHRGRLWLAVPGKLVEMTAAGAVVSSVDYPRTLDLLAVTDDWIVAVPGGGTIDLLPRKGQPRPPALVRDSAGRLNIVAPAGELLVLGTMSGLLELVDLRGERLGSAVLASSVQALGVRGDHVFAMSNFGDRLAWDLGAFQRDRCAVLREVWRRVPVVWEGGAPVRRPPPSDHECWR